VGGSRALGAASREHASHGPTHVPRRARARGRAGIGAACAGGTCARCGASRRRPPTRCVLQAWSQLPQAGPSLLPPPVRCRASLPRPRHWGRVQRTRAARRLSHCPKGHERPSAGSGPHPAALPALPPSPPCLRRAAESGRHRLRARAERLTWSIETSRARRVQQSSARCRRHAVGLGAANLRPCPRPGHCPDGRRCRAPSPRPRRRAPPQRHAILPRAGRSRT
jgi:hypothetical protein